MLVKLSCLRHEEEENSSLLNYERLICLFVVGPAMLPYILCVPFLKKLEYLKESLDIVRENPQFMANELLSTAIQKLDNGQFNEV